MIIALTLLVAFAGLLMMLIAVKPVVVRIGEIMFFCGLLAFLLSGLPAAVGLLSRHP
jgi:hypothetical protein